MEDVDIIEDFLSALSGPSSRPQDHPVATAAAAAPYLPVRELPERPPAEHTLEALSERASGGAGPSGTSPIRLVTSGEVAAAVSELGEPELVDEVGLLFEDLDSGQEECSAWLDDTIVALYQDLVQHRMFLRNERRARRAVRRAAAGRLGGDPVEEAEEEGYSDAGESSSGDDGEVPAAYGLVDWMHLGLMCERLKEYADAERAFRVACHQRRCLTASYALARIYAERGWVQECISAMQDIVAAQTKELGPRLPSVFLSAFANLMTHAGLQAIQEESDKRKGAEWLAQLLRMAIRFHFEGFDL